MLTSAQESPALPPTLSTIGASDDNTFTNLSSSQTTTVNPYRIAIKEVFSTSTLPEEDYVTSEREYEKVITKLSKVSRKYQLIMQNWATER